MSVAVVMRGVCKSFAAPGSGLAAQRVLQDVNVTLQAGTSTAITGPSGSGKSTLLNVIAGLERVDSGEIEVGGFALHRMKAAELDSYRLQTLATVFQFFHLLPTLNVIENVCLPAFEKFPRRKQELRTEAERLLERMGLSAFAKHFPSQLSGGMQSRTALVRTILCAPQLLLADEPTGSLDSKNGAEVLGTIADYQKQSGCTLVMVTHDEKAARLASCQVHMEDGRVSLQTEAGGNLQ